MVLNVTCKFAAPLPNINTKTLFLYKFSYEKRLKNRYSDLSQYLGLNYRNIEADPVKTRDNYKEIKKFIPTKVLNESNYYKDLLIEMKLFSSLIKNLNS